jgi:hypothetical protein
MNGSLPFHSADWRRVTMIGSTLVTLVAILAFLAHVSSTVSIVAATPYKLDSLRTAVQMHVDSSVKYGRLQVQYLCVLASSSARDRQDCYPSLRHP